MTSTSTSRRSNGAVNIGYSLSTEEHRPEDLVGFARRAEEACFEYASIPDHFHPWVSEQQHSGFALGREQRRHVGQTKFPHGSTRGLRSPRSGWSLHWGTRDRREIE